MSETKSLLRQIRDKESDLDAELEKAAGDSRLIVEAARREAEAIVRAAEIEGTAAAEAYARGEQEKLARELARLQEEARAQQARVLDAAEARLPRAVGKIVKAVTLQ